MYEIAKAIIVPNKIKIDINHKLVGNNNAIEITNATMIAI